MVDKYLTCIYEDCDGVMERLEIDGRLKTSTFKCNKCGRFYSLKRQNLEFGKRTFNLNDPNDPLRGGLK